MASPGAADQRPQRATLALLYSVVVVDLIGFGIVMPILPFFALDFDVGGAELGVLLTAWAAAQFLCAPLWGRLSDRVGRRPVLLATVAGTALALALLGFATSFVWMLAARVLAGAFAANVSVASATITDLTDETERTRYMGLLGMCFGVGFVLGPALGGLLAPYGNRVPIFFAAGLAAANTCYAAIALREPARRQQAAEPVSRLAILREPAVRRVCLANLLFSLGVSQLESMFPFFMADRFDYDARQVAFLFVGIAVVMGAVQGGALRPLSARLGERTLVWAGSALLAVSFAAIPLAPAVALLLVPLALSAVGRGIAQPGLMSLASFAAAPRQRGLVMGGFQSAASLARVIGPVTAGLLYDRSLAGPFELAAVLLAGVAVLGAGLKPGPR